MAASTTADAAPLASPRSPSKGRHHRLPGVIIFNVALPLALFGLASQYTTTLNAMILYTAPPLGKCVYELVRERHVDYISVVQLAITCFAIGLMVYTDDPRVVLIKDVVPAMVIALAIVVSALWPNGVNLIWLGYRAWYDAAHDDVARVDHVWRTSAIVRRRFRALAVAVGSVILAEDSLRLYLIFNAPLSTMLVVSPIVGITTGILLTVVVACSVKYMPELAKDAAVASESTSLLA